MLDLAAVVTALMYYDSSQSNHLHLNAHFYHSPNPAICTVNTKSPTLQFHRVPPDASSLAVVIKDEKRSLNQKSHYYWVLYNLPNFITHVSLDESQRINRLNEGLNSWGQQNYHSRCWKNAVHPVVIELYALDKRFSPGYSLTGQELEHAIKGHVIAQADISG